MFDLFSRDPSLPKQSLNSISIKGLFGHFDYEVDLSPRNGGITILSAPNGYGKSTILRLIDSLASGDYYYLIQEKYDRIIFEFSGAGNVEVVRKSDMNGGASLLINNNGRMAEIEDPFGSPSAIQGSFEFERYLPFISRTSHRSYRDDRTGEIFDRSEMLRKFRNHPIVKRRLKKEEWLEHLRESMDIYSIPTNRLNVESDPDFLSGENNKGRVAVVEAIARKIKQVISKEIKGQFEYGRTLEASFPKRLIQSLMTSTNVDKESIIKSIMKIKDYEDRYSKLGLLPEVSTGEVLQYGFGEAANAAFLVLDTYLSDICAKFTLLDEVASKLDVFKRSINELLAFKRIEISPESGLEVRVLYGEQEKIELTALSSGEQHLLVMLGKLVFESNKDSLVLLDEPEISLHPEWQERFLAIIEEIRTVTGVSALIATHSPLLIGDRWENVIELAQQVEEHDNSNVIITNEKITLIKDLRNE